MTDVRELLPLYALGALEGDEAKAVERAVEADPALAAELASYREAAAQMVVPVAPPPAVKARLLSSIGAGRFERFAARMARVFDVTIERARELLGLVDRAASWDNPAPGIGLVHFDGGPSCVAADCGFIRIEPGCTFPWHTHRGEEISIVLYGRLRDHTGREYGPGDELVQAVNSAHDITNIGTDPAIFAACARNGIEVGRRP